MSKRPRPHNAQIPPLGQKPAQPQQRIAVQSLLDTMKGGNEYGSIVSATPAPNVDVLGEIVRGIGEIEAIRQRPCIAYVGNVVRKDDGDSGVDSSDDLPFLEMIQQVPAASRKVDVFLATRGGSAQQVSRFVNALRARFDEVDFLIPSFCMSAGTLFALSGDNIWMTDRACLGPIDPQVPTATGRFVPAQALLLLVQELERQGAESLRTVGNVPWTAVRLIDGIDKKELGEALTASAYSIQMATEFMLNFKFRNWVTRRDSGLPVDAPYRARRAEEVAKGLADHEKWKSHGHSISREVLWNEIKLEIRHPDPDLARGIVRLWALFNWIFENTTVLKVITSSQYRYAKSVAPNGGKA